jgi:hypothetical protein
MLDPKFEQFVDAVSKRYLQELQFAEIRRAVQALSQWYVQKRADLTPDKVFTGRGKRAAFAAYYAPLHYLLVRMIVEQLQTPAFKSLVELGCGTGLAGCAWIERSKAAAKITGYDIHPAAIAEAEWTYKTLGIYGRAQQRDMLQISFAGHDAILAAFCINELSDSAREKLLAALLKTQAQILIVEPIAKSTAPWWSIWEAAFLNAGGRSDTWRFRPILPEFLAKMDKAAKLDHREIKGRSLYLKG